MEKEHISVIKIWENYLASIGDSTNNNKSYTSWYFCDNEKSANDLAKLVKEGVKRGTTGLYDLYRIENEEFEVVYK